MRHLLILPLFAAAFAVQPSALAQSDSDVQCRQTLKEYFEAISNHYNGHTNKGQTQRDAREANNALLRALAATAIQVHEENEEVMKEMIRECPSHTDAMLQSGARALYDEQFRESLGDSDLATLAGMLAGEVMMDGHRRDPKADAWHRGFETWFETFVAEARARR